MRLMRFQLVRCVGAIFLVAGMATQAEAAWWDFPLALGLAGITTAAGIASLGVGVFVAAPCEIGGAVAAGALSASAGPPPDQANYAMQASPTLNLLAFSSDPNASAALNLAAQNFDYDMSVAVQNTIGAEQSLARLEGAELVGTATDVANQQMWLQQFQNQTSQAIFAAGSELNTFATLFQTEFPTLSNLSITAGELTSTVTAEGSGTFASAEQQDISQWGLGSFEVTNDISPYIGGVSDAEIAQNTPMTFGQALSTVSADFLSVPEPTSFTLLGIGSLMALWAVHRRRKPV